MLLWVPGEPAANKITQLPSIFSSPFFHFRWITHTHTHIHTLSHILFFSLCLFFCSCEHQPLLSLLFNIHISYIMFRSRKHTPNTDPKRRFSLLPRSFSGFLRSKKSMESPAPTLPPAFITDDSSITDSSRSVPASPLSAHTAATLTSSIAAESGCYFGPPPPPPTDSIQPPSFNFGGCGGGSSHSNNQHYRSLQRRQGVGGDTLSMPNIHAAADSTDQYLQLGMQCHERGELEKATYYWRLSAENDSPLGLFFYGIALRHGWVSNIIIIIIIRHPISHIAPCI